MAFSYRLAFGPIFFLLFLCFFIFFTKLRNADVSLSLYQDLSSPSPFITLSLAPPSFPQPHLHSSVSNDRVEDKPNGEDGSVSNDRIVDEPNGEDGSVSNDRIEDKPNGQDGSVSNDRIEDKPNGEDGSVSNDRIVDKPNGEDGSVSNDRIEDKPNGEDGSVSNDRIVDEPNGEDGSVSNDRIEDKANGEEGSVSNGQIEDKPNGEDGMVSDGESATARGDLWMGGLKQCDLYMGTWVRDEERYPVYRVGSCPYVDEAYDCGNNGRPDSEYTKWRWKPYGCDLPRFNATDFLVRLRGKRLMLVGDSMNRNQFESILCLLREGLRDKKRMFETHGYKITKGRGYFIFKFKDYDCTVEFVRSHFLVREGIRINAHGNSNPTLSIDRIDKTSARWKRADILVFNTGHWWTHGKTARGKNYYKEGNFLYPQFDAVEAYRRALKTWGNWIDRNINPAKQLVFYRGYSSAHFRGGDWDSGGSCNGETEPVLSGAILNNYPLKMKIVEETIKRMKVPVILLNVTRLTNFRKDGHPSVYSKNRTAGKKVSTRRQDCSHWCLPGVPDAWNELIYAALVARSRKPKSIYLSNTQ